MYATPVEHPSHVGAMQGQGQGPPNRQSFDASTYALASNIGCILYHWRTECSYCATSIVLCDVEPWRDLNVSTPSFLYGISFVCLPFPLADPPYHLLCDRNYQKLSPSCLKSLTRQGSSSNLVRRYVLGPILSILSRLRKPWKLSLRRQCLASFLASPLPNWTAASALLAACKSFPTSTFGAQPLRLGTLNRDHRPTPFFLGLPSSNSLRRRLPPAPLPPHLPFASPPLLPLCILVAPPRHT